MIRNRLGTGHEPDHKREYLAVHAGHLLAQDGPAGRAVISVLGEGYRDDIGDQPQRSHALESFLPVRREVSWLAGAVENQVPDDPSVPQCDRQALTDDGVVMSCRVANQDNPVRKGRVSPGVIAGIGGTRPGGESRRHQAG